MIVYADGACRGNPGPMAIGASIQDGLGTEVEIVSALIGDGTNDIAEYRAAIEGLKRAKDLGAKKVELRMDSELVIRQIEGGYKVNAEHLKPLHSEVVALLQSFKKYRVKHIRREDNARAEGLANFGLWTRGIIPGCTLEPLYPLGN